VIEIPPCFHLIAGPNGAGKSTYARRFLARSKPPLPFVNTDDIARELGDWRLPDVQLRAGRESLTRLRRLLAERKSFAHETTLSGFAQIELARQAKARGWTVEMVFIILRDWSLSADRVASRVRRGGHDVPLSDIERRFARSLENFWAMLHLCDEWHLLDNTGITYSTIAYGTADQWIIDDYTVFQATEAFRRT